MIYLDKHFQKHWAGKNPFREADLLEGEIFRVMKNRRTFRFKIAGKSYFAKVHQGVGWGEIFKNIIMFKKPVVSARNEYEFILRLEKLGIDTMKVAAFGEKGKNPAKKESFIITEELTNVVSVEDICKNWKNVPAEFLFKKALIEHLAEVSRILHQNRIIHRDFYICHFLLDISKRTKNIVPQKIRTYLIDLHRAQILTKRSFRWIVKDIGGLWFSAMDAGLTRTDRFRFMKIYSGKTLRDLIQNDSKFWNKVQTRAEKMYRKEFLRKQEEH